MFYLSGSAEPTNTQEFIAALEGGVRQVLTLPPGNKPVSVSGSYPSFDSITVDLTGGQVDPARKIPKPQGIGQTKPAVSTKLLRVIGKPVQIDMGHVTLDLSAHDAQFNYDRDSSGRLLLLPGAWRDGQASAEIPKSDLDALMLSQAKAAAAQQGATITGLTMTLTRKGDRSLAADVRVTAKKMVFTGVVHLTGQVDVSENLTARVSNLDCRGEGVGGAMAAGFLKQKMKQFDGHETPLASFAVAGMRLSDVRISSVDPLRVEAKFGG